MVKPSHKAINSLEGQPAPENLVPQPNELKIRAMTLAIARTPVMFGEGKVIEMFRRMAIGVLENTKTAKNTDDMWSADYDQFMEKIAKQAAAARDRER